MCFNPIRINSSSISSRLMISNNVKEDITKIVKSLQDSSSLLKGDSETFQNKLKEQNVGFVRMLLGALGESLLGKILAGRGKTRAGSGSKDL